MERIKNLNLYQRIILIIVIVMPIIFFPLYSLIISREGYLYRDAILLPKEEDGATVYSGKIKGKQAVFTVTKDKSVTFCYDDKTYGPYTAKEDPSAVPENTEIDESLTGIELYDGEQLLFRGGVMKHSNNWWMYDENGEFQHGMFIAGINDETEYDQYGNVVDSMKPSIPNILDVMNGPSLSHKGDWAAWFYGLLICIFTVVSVLFADEIFRWNLAFQIRNAERAEPSEWEIFGRYAGWTMFTILAIIVFIVGLIE